MSIYDFLNIASKIFFIETVNILRKTTNNPNEPKIIAIDSKFEPKSNCTELCTYFKIINITLL